MTQKQRLAIYEQFMHRMHLYATMGNKDKVAEAVTIISNWSYAHRVGNGEYGPRQQQRIVDKVVASMDNF